MLQDIHDRRFGPILGLAMLAGLGCGASVTTTTTTTTVPVSVVAPSIPGAENELVELSRSLTYRIEPVGEPSDDGPSPLDVWRSLLSGIESDPETTAVLSRLFAGWPVQIERLDGPVATDDKLLDNPDDDHKFVVRLASLGVENEGVGASRRLIGTVAFGSASRHKVADPNDPSGLQVNMGMVPPAPKPPVGVTPGQTFGLLAEDYLLRHHPGWRLVDVNAEASEAAPTDLEPRRIAADQAIAKHAEAIRTVFGTPDHPLPKSAATAVAPSPTQQPAAAPVEGSHVP